MLCVIKINSTRLGHAWHVFCMHFDATPPFGGLLFYPTWNAHNICTYAYIVGTCICTHKAISKDFGICVWEEAVAKDVMHPAQK